MEGWNFMDQYTDILYQYNLLLIIANLYIIKNSHVSCCVSSECIGHKPACQ